VRSGRSLVVLAVVLGGLIAYWYFVDRTRPEGEQQPKVFDVQADAIRSVRIASAQEGTTVLVKDGDTWRMSEPAAAPADSSEVSNITSSLASLEEQGVVDEKPADLEPFGLAQPRVTVSFTTDKNDTPRRLLVGGRTPTEGHAYAKRDDEPRVFLIQAYLDSTFDKKPFDLRDKRILAFDRDKVDRIELTRGRTRVEAVKDGLDWRLTHPVRARADYSAIEGLISRLQSAQMTSIVSDEGAADLSKYGLASPEALATVGAGSTRATLAFGSPAPNEDLYVRDTSRPLVVTAAKSLLDEVQKGASDLRRKDVFEFRPFNVTRLAVTRGADTAVFEKEKSAEDTAPWRRASPAGDVDREKMEALLNELSGLRAQDFQEAAAGSPVLSVEATFDDGKRTEKVTFARSGSTVLATRADEAGAARIDAKEFDGAVAALDALK
jgi:hypothetical protein